jgi:hypothetical protein
MSVPVTMTMDMDNIINQQFALRKLLNNKAFHTSKEAIHKKELTLEKEPHIHAIIRHVAQQIVANPDNILIDTYTVMERAKDWLALLQKAVMVDNEVIHIDTRTRPGHKILDHHMPHFYEVKNYKGKSVKSIFTQATLEKALFTNVLMHSTPYKSEIRRMITMTGGLGSVTKYRTVTAKALVQFFGARRVLDPCTGWGGRLLGCLAAANDTYYVGCEPDKNTYKGLSDLLADEALPLAARARARILPKPAEVALREDIEQMAPFDMVLTSPPYFNLEQYTDSTDQSITTYTTWDDWLEKWLTPVILGALTALKPGGVSCWSVKNFKSDKHYPLADATKKIHADVGWTLVKVVAMTGSARPGAGKASPSASEAGPSEAGTGPSASEAGPSAKKKKLSEEETFCFKKL